MIVQNQNLGDWRSFIKKTRDIVHKAFPRELSPSRMLEKYAADTKKKAATKLSKLASASDTKNAADDAALAKKIATLESMALPSSAPKSIPFSAASAMGTSPGTVASAPDTTPNTLMLAGLFGAGALAIYFLSRRKR